LVNAFMPSDGNIIVPQDIELSGKKVLRVGTNVPFTPFEFLQGDKIVGFDISMSQNIAKDFDAKLEVVNMDFNALITALDAEAVNFVAAGLSVTEEHKKYVDFSQPYYTSSQVIIVKK
ncbi:MAG: transporter substrate-binding domain-containing protein, partial [Oscillospiraceae bacterium]